MSHYVYLYRDEHRHPRYVGYGELVSRANVHQIKSHNPELADFILSGKKFSIEVAGPFGTEQIGRFVESAVMSALNPDFNVARGTSIARFRPLGVPDGYSRRLSMPMLQRNDFISVQKDSRMPVLFVKVGDKDFGDGRAGYDLASPPSDDQIRERVEKWWQLSGFISEWAKKTDESPGVLVGIAGSPGSQIVIASHLIDRSAWGNVEGHPNGEGRVRVPLLHTPKLDAFNIRGRRVAREADIAFEGFPAGFYIILQPDGTLVGGRRPRKKAD